MADHTRGGVCPQPTARDQEGKATLCSTMKSRHSRGDSAVRAIQLLTIVDSSPLSSQQMAVLVSGSLLMCSWQYILQGLQDFEIRGFPSLLEVWMVVAASFGLGQLARFIARAAGADSILSTHVSVLEQEACSRTSSSSSTATYSSIVSPQPPVQRNGATAAALLELQQATDEEDDVGVQKRIAQAEAAAQLAVCQGRMCQLLASISSDITSSSSALQQLAEVLFESPMNVCELVDQGGVGVMVAAARSAVEELAAEHNKKQMLPALLQVSWVLLQVAHGPPACCAALASRHVSATLLELMKAVRTAAVDHQGSEECILRNLCWTMLLMCDTAHRGHNSSSCSFQLHLNGTSEVQATEAAAQAVGIASGLCASGAVDILQQLLTLQYGVSSGWVAAAALGLFTQLGQQQQQQDVLCKAVAQAALQPESLHGLGYLLAHQPQLSGRLQCLVYGLVHHLLTLHTVELLQLLVEEQLVGVFAASLPCKLARLLVCQLLSSRGQRVLATVEAGYELDVALALAQVVPLPVHLKLPCPPEDWQQQQHGDQQEELAAADGSGMQPAGGLSEAAAAGAAVEVCASAAAAEDMYTDILACRLLLQYERLTELLTAFADELLEHNQQQKQSLMQNVHQAGAAGQMLPPVSEAVCQLIKHLMTRDLQLQAVQHVRGDSVDDSQSNASSNGSSNSSSSAIEAALAAADSSGVTPQSWLD